MAMSEAKLAKFKDKYEKGLTKLREVRGEATGLRKLAGTIPAPALPPVGAVVTYVTGYGDAMMGNAQNKNPITLATGLASWLASGVAAFMGHPTIGQLAATSATATLGAMSHDRGYDKGLAGKTAG